MPTFNTYEDYLKALEALGCSKSDYGLLVSPSKRRVFFKASRERCEKFFTAHNRRFHAQTYRNQFLGYVGPVEQGLWCTWTDALCFGPSLSQADERTSARVFCFQMASRGYDELSPDNVLGASAEPEVLLRWQAWKAARAFWAEYQNQSKS